MSVVVLDGPEAAGKSTLRDALVEAARPAFRAIQLRRWGPVDGWHEYVPAMVEDLAAPRLTIWDRSWASEVVYDDLLRRGRDPDEDAVASQLEEPLITAGGVMLMLLPAARTLILRREERARDPAAKPDLQVHPTAELVRFRFYARRHGWSAVEGTPNPAAVAATIVLLLAVGREGGAMPGR